jgi:exodeoxyribonuclease V alpha subunit
MSELLLTTEQQAAVDHFRTHRFTLIHGGPGTGKTTVIRALLTVVGNEPTLLCAPTGNATNRIEKATGRAAHVLEKVLHDAAAIQRYQRCTLILDEASMISVDTLRLAMTSLHPKRLTLIGDSKQLPCMNGFSVLSTLMTLPAIPVMTLTRNHRQQGTSALVRTLGELGQGKAPETDAQFQIRTCKTKQDVLQKAASLYVHGKTQMLAFTNDMCTTLNHRTVNTLKASVLPGIHIGDRIVCTVNVYTKEKTLLVANGVIGLVKTSKLVLYENGFRDTLRPKRGFCSTFVPARCMTIHKSQGNEFDQTGIIVLGGWHNPPLEFIYTALSRFKNNVYVIGMEKDIREVFQTQFRPVIDRHVVDLFQVMHAKRTAVPMAKSVKRAKRVQG